MHKPAPPRRAVRLRRPAPRKPIQRLASGHRAGMKTRRIEGAGCREYSVALPPEPPLLPPKLPLPLPLPPPTPPVPARQTLQVGHPQDRGPADAGNRARVRKTFSASLHGYFGGLIRPRDRIAIWMTILRQGGQEADFSVSDERVQ